MPFTLRSARMAGMLGITLAVVLTLTLIAAPSGAASEAAQDSLTFSAVAQDVGSGGGGGQTQVALTFTRWNTEEERDELEQILINDGMQALADALRSAPEVGFIRAPTLRTTAWRLRYAIMFRNEEGQRVIRAATDRPVSFVEANQRMVRTWDYNVALIELTIDEEGNGNGWIRSGVEFVYHEETDSIVARNMQNQPIMLNNVRITR